MFKRFLLLPPTALGMESVFYDLNNENMNIEDLMKHHTEGGRMIRHLNGKKEYVLSEDDMQILKQQVKNCSIPDVTCRLQSLTKWDCSTGDSGPFASQIDWEEDEERGEWIRKEDVEALINELRTNGL